MKKLILLTLIMFSLPAWAHDEGHGPKLTDTPKQGGVLTAIINKAEIDKGEKAKPLYKAELVRYEDGKINVFIYSLKMEKVDLNQFENKAMGMLITCKKDKCRESEFSLTANDSAFTANPPKPDRKPYNIDIYLDVKGKKQNLFGAFDNLD